MPGLDLALSPCLTNQEAANSILARWLQLTNTAAVWSEKTEIHPLWGYPDHRADEHWKCDVQPNVTPIYNLTDDDFIHEDGKDPLEVVRSDPYASYNWQRLQINHFYRYIDAEHQSRHRDQSAIELYGLRMASDVTASEDDPIQRSAKSPRN